MTFTCNQHTAKPIRERFYERVRKTETCWLWTGGKVSAGYGAIKTDGKQVPAHRLSFELHHGPIPLGLCVCHRCDTPSCVNPQHLFLGTHRDNAHDRQRKGRGNAQCGELAGQAKLTEAQAICIKNDPRAMRAIAADFGIHVQQVFRIKHGLRWAHLLKHSRSLKCQ